MFTDEDYGQKAPLVGCTYWGLLRLFHGTVLYLHDSQKNSAHLRAGRRWKYGSWAHQLCCMIKLFYNLHDCDDMTIYNKCKLDKSTVQV